MVDYDKAKQRGKMDSHMIREISRSPVMSAEQGPSWLSAYGGPSRYVELSKIGNPDDRQVYLAVQVDGLGNPSEIAQVTGISESRVNSALARLSNKGLTDLRAEPIRL